MSDLEEMFSVLRGCCLHDPQWLPENVARVVTWVGDRQNGSDSSSIVIVQLKDRAYGLLVQSEDYTGHGCQCSSMTVKAAGLGDLLTHLDEYDLAVLLEAAGK